ncbi:MAG: TetR/AcrR family transcriptional regulator [Cyclobacteriaceae bacterium]
MSNSIDKQKNTGRPLADESKEKILFTAMQLFARHGFHKTPAALIAREAGISHGLMFYHFGSKEGLLKEIIEYCIQKINNIIDVSPQDQPIRQLEQISQRFRESLEEETHFWELYHSLVFQPDMKNTLARELITAFDPYRNQLVHIFEQLGYLNARDTMQQFETMRQGITVSYLFYGKSYPLKKLFQHLMDRFS